MRLTLGFLLAGQLMLAQPSRNLGAVRNPARPVHVVAFGDWGFRGEDSGQSAVAAAVRKVHAASPFDLGLTLGDNFYPNGVKSVDDSLWRDIWEADYGPIGIPFFATLGNHDYQGNEQAQVDYSAKSKTWRMPFRYYSFVAGPIEFFALDTDESTAGRLIFTKPWSDSQARWLDDALSRSKATWKIAYGHHPIFSDGHHGDEARLKAKLLPILKKHKVDLYLCGHEHDLQYIKREGMQFVIAGGGGKDAREVKAKRASFAAGRHGFLDLSAHASRLEWRLRASDGAILHQQALMR